MRLLVTGGSGFIGTNVIAAFAPEGAIILNYSIDPPLNVAQEQYWQQGDILEAEVTRRAFADFKPDHVLHLAARADCDENTTVEKGYRVNTEGTSNVLEAIRATPSVKRTVITSTQFVCAPGRLPENDTDYFPETVYGQSKVITEQLTRAANLQSCWTIIRPTNVWGPWHMRYRREFWRILRKGLYVHPGYQPVIRSYGYVRNVVDQIKRIFSAPQSVVNQKTIYVGDHPINLFDWAQGFSIAINGRRVRIVPRSILRGLALLGDIPTKLTGRPFFINSSRFRSMVTDYDTPMKDTFDLLGQNPISLQDGIRETVAWLISYQGQDIEGGGA